MVPTYSRLHTRGPGTRYPVPAPVPVPGTGTVRTRYRYPVFTSGQSTPSSTCCRTASMVNSCRDTQAGVDVLLRMRDRGWSRDCQPLPARRAAAHQQEDEIAQVVEHSDASRHAASAGPPRAVRARADLAGGNVVRAAQSCRRGRWRSRPAVQTPAQCAAGFANEPRLRTVCMSVCLCE